MISQKKSIVVNAPIEKVFDYITNPDTILEYWPSMVDVREIQRLPNRHHKFCWTYKMAGMRLDGSSENIEVIPNQKLVTKSTGGIDSVLTFALEAAGSGTRIDFVVDYTIPLPIIGKLAEAVIVKLNDQEGNSIMANLKTHLEA